MLGEYIFDALACLAHAVKIIVFVMKWSFYGFFIYPWHWIIYFFVWTLIWIVLMFRCIFCDEEKSVVAFYNSEYCCPSCDDHYGLGVFDRKDKVVLISNRNKVAEIIIEELPCDGKL